MKWQEYPYAIFSYHNNLINFTQYLSYSSKFLQAEQMIGSSDQATRIKGRDLGQKTQDEIVNDKDGNPRFNIYDIRQKGVSDENE